MAVLQLWRDRLASALVDEMSMTSSMCACCVGTACLRAMCVHSSSNAADRCDAAFQSAQRAPSETPSKMINDMMMFNYSNKVDVQIQRAAIKPHCTMMTALT